MEYNEEFCDYKFNANFQNCEKKLKKNEKLQKKSKKKRVLIKILIFLLVFLFLVYLFFNFYVNPQIVKSNTAQIKSYSINLINSAVSNTIVNNDYDDLITILKDTDGNVSLLQVNSNNVNKLNNNIMTVVQNKLNEKDILNYKLPLGSFSGIPALSGFGPNVDLKIIQVGNVTTKYRSQILGLSINQSYHKIYITINVSVCIFLPLYTQNIEVSSQVLVAENLIVGKIPSTYLNTDNLTNALNLIP